MRNATVFPTSGSSDVTRYTDGGPEGWMQSPTGEFVAYADYERLRDLLRRAEPTLRYTELGEPIREALGMPAEPQSAPQTDT